MSSDHEAADVPRLSAGEPALLAALIEFPETTVSGVANAARVSTSMARRALRRFEALGAAARASPPGIEGTRVPELWSASSSVLHMLSSTAGVQASEATRPTTRDKILTAVGLRPGLPLGEISWCTALSRRYVVEMLAVLEREGLVRRVSRTGRSGRLADGWVLALADPDEPLFGVDADDVKS